jgi:hypothetical protein
MTMQFSKIKISASAVLLSALAVAGLRQVPTRAAVSAAIYDGTYRVATNEVLIDDSTVVKQLRIEALPGSRIEVWSDDKRGANKLSAVLSAPIHPIGPSTAQLIVFADQVELNDGSTNAVKFLLGFKAGSISTGTSNTTAMPNGSNRLSDVLKVHIQSGEYSYGQETKLLTFMGVTYSVVVTRTR